MFMPHHIAGFGGGDDPNGPPYPVNATDYDGSTNYLTRGAAIVPADTYTLTFACCFRLDGGDGVDQRILATDSGGSAGLFVTRNSLNKIVVVATNAAGSSLIVFSSTTSYTASATWHRLQLGLNTNFGVGSKIAKLLIDGVDETNVTADPSTAFQVALNSVGNIAVGAFTGGAGKFNGCLAEVYLDGVNYIDPSTAPNQLKFTKPNGKPQNLLTTSPTGATPALYLKDPYSSIGTNSGAGGNFTTHGTFFAASSSPSD